MGLGIGPALGLGPGLGQGPGLGLGLGLATLACATCGETSSQLARSCSKWCLFMWTRTPQCETNSRTCRGYGSAEGEGEGEGGRGGGGEGLPTTTNYPLPNYDWAACQVLRSRKKPVLRLALLFQQLAHGRHRPD